MTRIWIAVSTLLLAVLFATAAPAAKRVALLIGNSSYASAGKLPNPPNDVALMKAALTSAGFDKVETAADLDHDAMVRRLRSFEDDAADSDIALIYYSGHGLELNGSNYLVPVDAQLASDRDVEDETVTLTRALRAVDGARKLKLVILDACRNNPFLAKMARAGGTRAIDRGLARVEPETGDTLIAFAAKAGTVASDGDGTNSPFAQSLAKRLVEPGVDIRLALGEVRDDVMAATHQKQEPFAYGSLGGGAVPLVPGGETAPAAAAPLAAAPVAPTAVRTVQDDFDFAVRAGTVEGWRAFLALHPSGAYTSLAKAQIAALTKPSPTAPPAEPPKVAALVSPPPSDDAGQSAAPDASAASEGEDFGSASVTNTVAGWQAFLRRHPGGSLAEAARRELASLEQSAPPPPAAAPGFAPGQGAGTFANETADFGVRPQSTLRQQVNSPTPLTLPGARTVTTGELIQIFTAEGSLIDVLDGVEHPTLPNAFWLPGAGNYGTFSDRTQAQFAKALALMTRGNWNQKLAFYCMGANCWESYNAALRALRLGFKQVYWYRGGLNAWTAAGYPTQPPQANRIARLP